MGLHAHGGGGDGLEPFYDWVGPMPRRLGFIAALMPGAAVEPFAQLLFLASLPSAIKELGTSQEAGVMSVAVYIFASGIGGLLIGPAADRFGRRAIYLATGAAFVAATLGCAFVTSIGSLIAARAMQGLFALQYLYLGTAVIADTFPPGSRGAAVGVFAMAYEAATLVAPVLGGALGGAFGWRSVFYAQAAAGAVALASYAFAVPETQWYWAWRARARGMHGAVCAHVTVRSQAGSPSDYKDPDRPLQEQEEEQRQEEEAVKLALLAEHARATIPPRFHPPWRIMLLQLGDPRIAPHAAFLYMMYACSFALAALLPLNLASPPYKLDDTRIGALLLAQGAAAILASPLGGWLADKTYKFEAARAKHARDSRSRNAVSSGNSFATSYAASDWDESDEDDNALAISRLGSQASMAEGRNHPPSDSQLWGVGLIALGLMVSGLLLFGWALHRVQVASEHYAAAAIAQALFGGAVGVFYPAVHAVVTQVSQREAAAGAAGIESLMGLVAGALTMVIQPLHAVLNSLPLAAILAAVVTACGATSIACALRGRWLPAAAAFGSSGARRIGSIVTHNGSEVNPTGARQRPRLSRPSVQ